MNTIDIIGICFLSFISILLIIMFKTMMIDPMRFSGYLQKEIYEGKQRWFILTASNRKLPLSKIYNIYNPDTLRLKEGEYYKMLMPDKNGGFIIPRWSIFQIENGYLPEKKLSDDELSDNYESFWAFITK